MRRVAITAAMGIFLSSCAPENSTATGFLTYKPDYGYKWVDPDYFWYGTEWAPGTPHPENSRVRATDFERQWEPAPGYAWTVPSEYGDIRDFRAVISDVAWRAGLNHPDYDHILSDDQVNSWIADPGYVFNGGSLNVVWQQGLKNPEREHFVSSEVEGEWVTEAGYVEVPVFGLFGERLQSIARWSPGTIHPNEECMMAAADEGRWQAIRGYHLARNGSTGLIVVGDEVETNWGRVAAGLVVAYLGYSASQPTEEDGLITRGVVRPIATEVAKAGLNSAANAVGSRNTGICDGKVINNDWFR